MRLIDADFLLWKLNHDCVPFNADVNAAIRNAATIDAVGVIRCKDCKNWLTVLSSGIAENGFCELDVTYGRLRKREDFCSDAQRKTE